MSSPSTSEVAEAPRTPTPFTIAALFCLLCVIWGSTWYVIKEGLEDLPPLTSAGIRFGIAFVFIAVILAITRKRDGGGTSGSG